MFTGVIELGRWLVRLEYSVQLHMYPSAVTLFN